MIQQTIKSLFLLLLLSGCSCTIDDDDRCQDGYIWDAETKSCLEEPTGDTGTQTEVDTATSTSADPDGSVDSDNGITGLGEECWKDEECAGYQANYCQLNALYPDQVGFCTLINCLAGDCPAGWQCCDCSNIAPTRKPSCVTDEGAALALSYGCTCEQ